MAYTQVDMFADTSPATEKISPELLARVRGRLEATLARLSAEARFCWSSNLEAIHEENSFRSGAQLLGKEGTALWDRFDREMDRLYATLDATLDAAE